MWGNVTRSFHWSLDGLLTFSKRILSCFQQIRRTPTARVSFSPHKHFLEFKIEINSLKITQPVYIVFVRFYLGEKSAMLKGSRRSRSSSKSTAISLKMEGEIRLRVFRAHSRILLRWSEVI